MDRTGTDVARFADYGEAGDLEEEAIGHGVNQSFPLQHDSRDQVVDIDGNGAVVVDDQSGSINWQMLQSTDLVAVVESGVCIPDGRDDLTGHDPEVPVRRHCLENVSSGRRELVGISLSEHHNRSNRIPANKRATTTTDKRTCAICRRIKRAS